MRKSPYPSLILASASVQRGELLKRLHIPFKVVPSRAKEITQIKTTCEALVKANALLKARDVADKLKKGIVIGADTLVYLGKKTIIGKPKDLKAAKRVLKTLFAQPHWVYTGVAVIDAATGRAIVDHEKTKLFMSAISDKEIDRYHKRVSPLDKAGGFDIEGQGGLFIRRIEGCYTNVIGLPLPKLCRMLKKFGVTAFLLLSMVWMGGCATQYNTATGEHETLMYGDEKESQIGTALSRQLEKNSTLNTDVDVNERVEAILDRIVEVCDRKDLVYFIKVIDEDKMNAVSLPGGYIYVYQGLIDKVDNDDQLAAVIAHEVGHITAKHSMKKLQSVYGYGLLQLAAVVGARSSQLSRGMDTAFLSVFMEYSRADEFQADQLGIKYMKKAGYNHLEMEKMLKKLEAAEAKEPIRPFSYWRTHPYISQRISAVNKEVSGHLEFRDYLNLTGEN